MRKFTIMVVTIIILITSIQPIVMAAEAPTISCENAIVMDTVNDFVLYDKKSEERVYPAGSVKIMTAILALEKANGNFDEKFIVSETAINHMPMSAGQIVKGEELSIRDLLYAMMLVSSNEASNTLAEYVSGNISDFVVRMNEKAKELGCENTNFTNPSGIYDEASYSTARDVARITKYAISIDNFLQISGTYTYYIEPTNLNSKRRLLITTNQIASASSAYYISYAKVVKSASVSEAGNSLITIGEKKIGKKSRQILVITLGCPKAIPVSMATAYNETKSLFEWAYTNFKVSTLIKANDPVTEINVKLSDGKDFVILTAKETVEVLIPEDFAIDKLEKLFDMPKEIMAPVIKDQVIGKLTMKYNGIEYAKVDLIAQSGRERNVILWYSFSLNKFFGNIFVRIISILLILLFIFYISITLYYNNQRKKRKSVKRRIKL